MFVSDCSRALFYYALFNGAIVVGCIFLYAYLLVGVRCSNPYIKRQPATVTTAAATKEEKNTHQLTLLCESGDSSMVRLFLESFMLKAFARINCVLYTMNSTIVCRFVRTNTLYTVYTSADLVHSSQFFFHFFVFVVIKARANTFPPLRLSGRALTLKQLHEMDLEPNNAISSNRRKSFMSRIVRTHFGRPFLFCSLFGFFFVNFWP